MRTTHPYVRRLQHCMLALLLLALCLIGTAPVTKAQPAAADFAAIDTYIEAQMGELRIPGLALGIVEGDQIVHVKGFGVANQDGGRPRRRHPSRLHHLANR
jgi:CubicO group peptidase (beta-lactamase class C family)